MELAGLLLRQLICRPHLGQPRDPLLELHPAHEIRRQEPQLPERVGEVGQQGVHLVDRDHVELQRVHGRDEILRALGRSPVLHYGGHPRCHQAVYRCRAVHLVGVSEALDAGDGVFEHGS